MTDNAAAFNISIEIRIIKKMTFIQQIVRTRNQWVSMSSHRVLNRNTSTGFSILFVLGSCTRHPLVMPKLVV